MRSTTISTVFFGLIVLVAVPSQAQSPTPAPRERVDTEIVNKIKRGGPEEIEGDGDDQLSDGRARARG